MVNSIFELSEPSSYILVSDNQSLKECCGAWSNKPFLALDTEFIRTSTFYPKIGLIQICDGESNYLLDPLVIDDWSAFKELMLCSGLLKIFHSCSEDLLVFLAFLEVIPKPIFDTQIASAFLNEGFALSYQNLVKEHKGIDIPKGETRSDWLQRPLTPEQFKYAALDVAYLPEIFTKQTQRLEEMDKLSWLQEECAGLFNLYKSEVDGDFSQYYLNIKSAWQLNSLQLAALKSLASWREERARKRNKPRSWIIKDKELVMIAKSLPQDKQQLGVIPNIPDSFINHEGEEVLEIIRVSKTLDESELPKPLPRPLTSGQKNKLKKAQQYAESKALELNLPVELFARRRCLMALFNNIILVQGQQRGLKINQDNIEIPEELQGWRKAHLLEPLIEILQ